MLLRPDDASDIRSAHLLWRVRAIPTCPEDVGMSLFGDRMIHVANLLYILNLVRQEILSQAYAICCIRTVESDAILV
jgi:hypothetical protein